MEFEKAYSAYLKYRARGNRNVARPFARLPQQDIPRLEAVTRVAPYQTVATGIQMQPPPLQDDPTKALVLSQEGKDIVLQKMPKLDALQNERYQTAYFTFNDIVTIERLCKKID